MTLTRTLVFCTAFAGSPAIWDLRYKFWLHALLCSKLERTQILFVDDGSNSKPDWPGMVLADAITPDLKSAKIVFFTFKKHLGRSDVFDYPGWFRSFCFPAEYSRVFAFDKIVHVESDAFLISQKLQQRINTFSDGWLSLWTTRRKMPESGIQIIAGRGIDEYRKFAENEYSVFKGYEIEKKIPFTHVEKNWYGDRFENAFFVPPVADWAMQVDFKTLSDGAQLWPSKFETPLFPSGISSSSHPEIPVSKYRRTDITMPGVSYIQFFKTYFDTVRPRLFVEIGTGEAGRLAQCNIACFNPTTQPFVDTLPLNRDITILGKNVPSSTDLEVSIFSNVLEKVDGFFIDGVHLFERVLDDFIFCESVSHPASTIFIHDCFPLNKRMAERTYSIDNEESASTRQMWTGDVWKILEIFRVYRPDLAVLAFDCEPTGLVAVGRLDACNRVLANKRDEILAKFISISLETAGASLPTTLSSAVCSQEPVKMSAALWKLRNVE